MIIAASASCPYAVDVAGRPAADALIAPARAGVFVRLIVDKRGQEPFRFWLVTPDRKGS